MTRVSQRTQELQALVPLLTVVMAFLCLLLSQSPVTVAAAGQWKVMAVLHPAGLLVGCCIIICVLSSLVVYVAIVTCHLYCCCKASLAVVESVIVHGHCTTLCYQALMNLQRM